MRKVYATNLQAIRPDFILFNESLNESRRDFQTMLTMPVDSIELQAKLLKYEKKLEFEFDPNMIICIRI